MHPTHTLDAVCSIHDVLPAAAQHERRARWVVGLTATALSLELVLDTFAEECYALDFVCGQRKLIVKEEKHA